MLRKKPSRSLKIYLFSRRVSLKAHSMEIRGYIFIISKYGLFSTFCVFDLPIQLRVVCQQLFLFSDGFLYMNGFLLSFLEVLRLMRFCLALCRRELILKFWLLCLTRFDSYSQTLTCLILRTHFIWHNMVNNMNHNYEHFPKPFYG